MQTHTQTHTHTHTPNTPSFLYTQPPSSQPPPPPSMHLQQQMQLADGADVEACERTAPARKGRHQRVMIQTQTTNRQPPNLQAKPAPRSSTRVRATCRREREGQHALWMGLGGWGVGGLGGGAWSLTTAMHSVSQELFGVWGLRVWGLGFGVGGLGFGV